MFIVKKQADNHGGTIKIGNQRQRCYTKKQLRAFHPNGYELVGECWVSKLTGDVIADDEELRPPKTYSRWRYAEKGYWSCGGNRYIVLMTSALPQRVLLLLATCLLVAAAILSAVYWPQLSAYLPMPEQTSSVALDPNTEDYIGEKVQSNKGNLDAANTQIPGYKSIEIDATSGELNIAPHNPEGNPCYFVISLLVDGKEIYKSGMIAPGQGLYHSKVTTIPQKGNYTATVKYECFHLTTQAPLNGAEINVELIVK